MCVCVCVCVRVCVCVCSCVRECIRLLVIVWARAQVLTGHWRAVQALVHVAAVLCGRPPVQRYVCGRHAAGSGGGHRAIVDCGLLAGLPRCVAGAGVVDVVGCAPRRILQSWKAERCYTAHWPWRLGRRWEAHSMWKSMCACTTGQLVRFTRAWRCRFHCRCGQRLRRLVHRRLDGLRQRFSIR